MTIRQVFVVWSHPLFLDSLRMLLKHPQIEVMGVTIDDPELPKRIAGLQPDIVLLEGDGVEKGEKAMQILEKSRHDLRVICLNIQDNTVSVYSTALRTLNRMDDLLELVLKE